MRMEKNMKIIPILFPFHTIELYLEGGVPTEEIHDDFQRSLMRVNLDDFSFISFEWSTLYRYKITDLEVGREFFTLFSENPSKLIQFCSTDWYWYCPSTEKSCHIWRVSYDIPTFIRDDHIDEDISWKDIFLFLRFFPICLYRYTIMCRYEYIEDRLFETKCFSSLHNRLADIFFCP